MVKIKTEEVINILLVVNSMVYKSDHMKASAQPYPAITKAYKSRIDVASNPPFRTLKRHSAKARHG